MATTRNGEVKPVLGSTSSQIAWEADRAAESISAADRLGPLEEVTKQLVVKQAIARRAIANLIEAINDARHEIAIIPDNRDFPGLSEREDALLDALDNAQDFAENTAARLSNAFSGDPKPKE